MSAVTDTGHPEANPHGEALDEHALHDAHPFLQHHFDSPKHQFESGKLGIWIFLVTEVLFFSGLFCAYSVYRGQHPEIFFWAHYYLDTNLGALNTGVLILSSLTAAWAVRNAQLGQQRLLVANILVTIACAFTFMGVKYVEYSHKFHDGLLWGGRPTLEGKPPTFKFDPHEPVWETHDFKHKHPEAAAAAARLTHEAAAKPAKPASAAAGATPTAPGAPGSAAPTTASAPSGSAASPGPSVPIAANPLASLTDAEALPLLRAGVLGPRAVDPNVPSRPKNAHVFFGIYFFMTGLHGVHVIGGIIAWIWLLVRALRGHFGPKYFGPIDFAALYWHLVDLVWIYLFPLLYLIH